MGLQGLGFVLRGAFGLGREMGFTFGMVAVAGFAHAGVMWIAFGEILDKGALFRHVCSENRVGVFCDHLIHQRNHLLVVAASAEQAEFDGLQQLLFLIRPTCCRDPLIDQFVSRRIVSLAQSGFDLTLQSGEVQSRSGACLCVDRWAVRR